jgi:hypothetical protein
MWNMSFKYEIYVEDNLSFHIRKPKKHNAWT